MNETTNGSRWRPGGILARISALSWFITILTLGIFTMATVPAQQEDLLEALKSKARGISFSLQEVTASAAVSEDYSSVVDQCIQVLQGDEAIDFLVIAKNDGTAVIVDRQGWRSETLDESWRPAARQARGGIDTVPLFGRRVYRFARPFNYSSIEWGWIHVGLSLESYDLSVRRVYERTAWIAILCLLVGLAASVFYAQRITRPILGLQSAVARLARGDLAARAEVHSRDEVQILAESFNQMASSILQRNQILESVRSAAHLFLTAPHWQDVLGGILERVGTAAHAQRAAVIAISLPEGAPPVCRTFCLWESPETKGTWRHGPLEEAWTHDGRDRIAGRLRESQLVIWPGGAPDEPAPGSTEAYSILIPIHVGGEWFGCAVFDGRARREWSPAEQDSFRTLAGMLGASIARQRTQEALVEAKQTLEHRVVERTRELSEQMEAKEKAHAELGEAQQRLIELSRASGMAEIATGVLHNVGNVLNSVNVSASIVSDKVRQSRLEHLPPLLEMLQAHQGRLDAFLKDDPKGMRILPYLAKLSGHLRQENATIVRELGLLTDHIGHIKGIVSIQQDYAKVGGILEQVSLAGLARDALQIIRPSLLRHSIQCVEDFEPLPVFLTDKHQIIQILLNLMRNAKQAITDAMPAERRVTVRIRRHGEAHVRLTVEDTGIGLEPDNLTCIFAHGFTTRRDGHGFGLHSGALAARQLGGALWAESEGVGRGARFTLELPLELSVESRGSVTP